MAHAAPGVAVPDGAQRHRGAGHGGGRSSLRPVDRQVEPPALAAKALDALFDGPAAEKAEGLELVTSGATGYTGLHIENEIASVRLERGCASNGSTMTIAGAIPACLEP